VQRAFARKQLRPSCVSWDLIIGAMTHTFTLPCRRPRNRVLRVNDVLVSQNRPLGGH
jgi:hypothetical protein